MACAMVPHMPNLPNGRETLTSPRSSLPSKGFPPGRATEAPRRLSLHTLVHGRLKPYKVQYLGSSGILDTARAQNTHTPYTTYYMNPYIRDTERLVCGSLALASAPLYGFPKARNISPEQFLGACLPKHLEFRGFDTRTGVSKNKIGRRALSSK